jgi:multiubiquitin
MTKADASETAAGPHDHTVVVKVNNQPVTVPAPKATGRQIKEAAIATGLPIQLDFVLSQVLPNDRTKIVGDNDEITVNKNSEFAAVAPDDNS